MKILLATLLALPFLTQSPAQAQGCTDNQYPVTFVDAAGNPAPTDVENGETFARFDHKNVYMSLSRDMPSGIYYVQVSDLQITTVLATTAQLDRIFQVTNDAGVITITRLSSTPGLPAPGVGLDGVGQSIPLFPLTVPPASSPYPCRFKAWIGCCYVDGWSSNNDPLGLPWGIRDGVHPGGCCDRSYARFTVGDGSGYSTINGLVFDDLDQDGVRDGNEPGLLGWQVILSGANSGSTTTGAGGAYQFTGLGAGTYAVALVVPPGSGCSATTGTSFSLENCGCAPATAPQFGVHCRSTATCDGHTPGFWSNNNGRALIDQYNLLARLPSLSVRTANGALFSTTNYNTFRTWLKGSNATNMAYKLSSHVVAMDFNRAVGFVDGDCTIQDPHLGTISIDNLMSQAIAALAADGYTPTGDPNRVLQERLKNALDAANNNQNWY